MLCTCVAAGGELLKKVPFQMVLIDETAQSTEPSCLVPLAHGCRQLALVGDHKQVGGSIPVPSPQASSSHPCALSHCGPSHVRS